MSPLFIFVLFLLSSYIDAGQDRNDLFLESLKQLVDDNHTYFGNEQEKFLHPERNTRFLLFTRDSEDYTKIELGNVSSLKDSKFNFSRDTKILIHGWLSSGTTYFASNLKDAYLKTNDVNIINVDWPSFTLYSLARIAVDPVAKIVTQFIDFLIESGVDKSSIHVLGHSLGAHVAGMAGRNIKAGLLPHITGFDPALPLFSNKPNKRLDKSDATFVDVIHTSAGFIGFSEAIGHIDFYPNGGTPIQPGCGFDIGICSHCRSYDYFIDSLVNNTPFYAVLCNTYKDFKNGHCCTGLTKMGASVDIKARGIYYLQTAESSPFALGKGGITDTCWSDRMFHNSSNHRKGKSKH